MYAPNYDDLIARYLDVCNQALTENKDRFPFKQILGAAEKSERGAVIEVNVIDVVPTASYAMILSKSGLVATPHGACSDCKCERAWNVTADYLQTVANNPDIFIQNPAKIDWEWMYDAPVQ